MARPDLTRLPVGTPVDAYPGPDADFPDAPCTRTVTRSRPWLLGGHTWVVMVEGIAGGIALTHIHPVTAR